MDLPIDHFRLLGVSPSADAQTVLRTLQSRLDRVPHGGFSQETLQARADLLRASADLLCDHDRRATYEAELTGLAGTEGSMQPALEIATTRQVGGLLLLLEGGQPLEAFELASRSLQQPRSPTLGNGRETDLTHLAGLSCLEAARELEEQRRFEAAARTLRQGLQLLQRLGRQPELRETMSARLERLTPYRVLDLLSRDLAAIAERREGLALLEQLVQRRGGLEGDGDPHFPREDFQPFFHQIRSYLTVQEQVDLFSRWAASGSEAADFLATIALTASGFAQRKPERIGEARSRLQRSGREGVEPLLANLHLLLGEADTARTCFDSGASEELKDWAADRSSDPLGQLCAYCSDWLVRDVLPGYRDLDAEPDLVAYFSDRDVVAYVEWEDQRRGRAYASAPAATPAAAPPPFQGYDTGAFPADSFAATASAPEDFAPLAPAGSVTDPDDERNLDDEVPLRWPLPPRPWLLAGGAALLLVLAGGWILRQRRDAPPPPPSPAPAPLPATPARPPAASPSAAPSPSSGTATGPSLALLTSPRPDAAQVRRLLESWLTVKGDVLAGEPVPQDLDRIARDGPVNLLIQERRRDAVRGQTQRLDVRITDLTLSESGPRRLVAVARLRYSDRRLDGNGKVVETTAPMELRNGYVFGRDGDSWRLVATQSLD